MLWSCRPSLALQVQRCHDRGRTGWFILIGVIPIIGGIWLFVELFCLTGTPGPDDYGPDPRDPNALDPGDP